MEFSLFAIQSIVTAALALGLGIFILANNWKKKINVLWFLVSCSIFLWSLGLGLEVSAPNANVALIWNRVLYVGAISIPVLFYHFVTNVLNIEKKRQVSILLGYFFTALFLVTNFTTLFVNGVPPAAGFKYWVSGGPLYYPYFLFFVIYFVYSLLTIVYYINTIKIRGQVRQQAKFVLLATAIGFFGGVTNFLPQLVSFYPFGNYFVIIYIAFMAYAIVKHRLMDIRLVVARSVAYIVLLALLAGLYAGSVLGLERVFFPTEYNNFSLAQGALRTIITVVMVFIFQPIRKWVTKVTDKIFFKNAYDKDELLNELSHTLGSTIVLIEMLYRVSDLLTKEMKTSRSLFALVKDENRLYTVQANGYQTTPEVDPKDVLHITKDGLMVADELEDNSTHKRLLRSYDAAIAVPLKTDKEVVGVLLLGEKSSGDMYSQQDLSVLEIIAPEIAVAIENAKSYEEINRFNVTLRQEVKHATGRLKLKNEQLMELDRAKDEFISMASHQLRTPLTAIKGYLSMLLEGDAGDIKVSQYDFINEAYSGANRMVGLINDLLNVSRMETGRFFLEPKEIDIERVVAEEVKQLSNSAKTKGLYLKVEKKGKIPHIWADETKIRQVIMNFMDNAIYYTNTGGVTVALRHDKNFFYYEVHDTGIGVPKAQVEHLFEKFFRADNARTARPDGTGLGIYLAKRVIEDHGGEIIFDSTEGKGSVFGFKFPLKKKVGLTRASAPQPLAKTVSPEIPMATEVATSTEGAGVDSNK